MFKASIVLALALSASTAGAAVPDSAQPVRVAILDTISFTPALERVNARQRVEEGVASVARARGWEPVTVASDCRDAGCASALAAQARVPYVLILVGRFVAADTYATDVGVALWHDGTVVGTKTETEEDAERATGTAAGPRCGPPDGTCTPQLLESKLEQYTARVLDDESTAARARRLAAITPVAATPPAPIVAVPPLPADQGSRVGRIVGWSLVGAGVALGGGAVAFWVANSSKTHCSPAVPADVDGCRYQWHTTTPAIVLGVAGAAAAAAGVVLLISERPASRLALTVHASGIGFEGSF